MKHRKLKIQSLVIYKLIGILYAGMILAPTFLSGKETEGEFVTSVSERFSYVYVLSGKKEENLPLIVYLHGSGERGDSTEKLKQDSFYRALVKADLQAVILAPVCESQKRWNAVALHRLVQQVIKQRRIDPRRIYLVGYSMGAFGVWDMAVNYPHEIAAVVPIAGGGDPVKASKIKGMPIWAFHGKSDKAVSADYSIRMVASVNKHGGNAKLTLFENVGHGCLPEVIKSDYLTWLMSQRLKEAK